MKKLVLIDGNSIAYRAFFALPLLNNDKGVYTNAVYGFTMMLQKVIEEEKPTHMLVAFDAGKSTFRHATYPEYKSGREKTPSELREQFSLIREILDAYQITRFEIEQYEADDIIGTVATKLQDKDVEVVVYTGDKDLLQLIDSNTRIALTRKGITNVDQYDEKVFFDTYGLKPEQMIDMKGLMGDSSDNIPGVPGIGEKTAIKLLKQFGTVEKVLASVDEISGKKMKERLVEFAEQARMSKQLATIHCDVPLGFSLDDLTMKEPEKDSMIALFKELGFQSLLEKMTDGKSPKASVNEGLKFEKVTEVKAEMLATPTALVVEMIEENYHEAAIVGFSLVNETGTYYISKEIALQSELFRNWAENEEKKKWLFDGKRAIVALNWQGIHLKGVEFDLLLAAYLLDPSLVSDELADISKRFGEQLVDYDDSVYGKGAKRHIPDEDVVALHLARKAEAIYELKPKLEQALHDNDQTELLTELEMPLSIILAEMERQGVQVAPEKLQAMKTELEASLQTLEANIYELAGSTFNINSPKQLGEILFEKLQLPPLKKTKTGYSTSAEVLEKLRDQHEIIEEILHYRQLGKLKSTYIDGLLKVIHHDTNKIHTMFNQANTQTGRLSSTEPNLQNIPIRLEEGRKIRQAFIPSEKDWFIIAADYSQIELRVLAHIAKDERLIEAFHEEMDIHTKTAMDVFHVSEAEVTSEMRRSAKAVNFGIIYGISDYGLSQNLGITRKEASEFIERYFVSYPKVKQYMDNIVSEARQSGYVTTLLKRRRYLPDLTSKNFNQRSFAERTAMNTPIQGSAADIIKKAMVEIVKKMRANNLRSRLLLQVHDELIFEVPKEEIESMSSVITDVMENALTLDVPLKVDISVGHTWYDAK